MVFSQNCGSPFNQNLFSHQTWPTTPRYIAIRNSIDINKHNTSEGWVSLKLYPIPTDGYGSIPINTIFRGMNIHSSIYQLFSCELQGYYWFWHTAIFQPLLHRVFTPRWFASKGPIPRSSSVASCSRSQLSRPSSKRRRVRGSDAAQPKRRRVQQPLRCKVKSWGEDGRGSWRTLRTPKKCGENIWGTETWSDFRVKYDLIWLEVPTKYGETQRWIGGRWGLVPAGTPNVPDPGPARQRWADWRCDLGDELERPFVGGTKLEPL